MTDNVKCVLKAPRFALIKQTHTHSSDMTTT